MEFLQYTLQEAEKVRDGLLLISTFLRSFKVAAPLQELKEPFFSRFRMFLTPQLHTNEQLILGISECLSLFSILDYIRVRKECFTYS